MKCVLAYKGTHHEFIRSLVSYIFYAFPIISICLLKNLVRSSIRYHLDWTIEQCFRPQRTGVAVLQFFKLQLMNVLKMSLSIKYTSSSIIKSYLEKYPHYLTIFQSNEDHAQLFLASLSILVLESDFSSKFLHPQKHF